MPFAHHDDLALYYETFGSTTDPTLLLVNGLGGQCTNYHVAWCERLVARGFHVIRFDNRDVGLSTKLDGEVPGGNASAREYRLSDMARDAIAVLDAAVVERAHVMGVSMGGMIVQTLSIEHPERLLSVTSIMSTTGEPEVGQATPAALAQLNAPPPVDRESYVENSLAGLRIWGSPAYADEHRWRADAERAFDRCFSPEGRTRQLAAIRRSGSRARGLGRVDLPTLVIHGDRDTLIDQSGGRRTAELVHGARFELIEGMGHDHPPQLWDRWVSLIARHASQAIA
jgi:pimeloyl-ACP methyl ester carboxylesterase